MNPSRSSYLFQVAARAQNPGESFRSYCELDDPKNNCPGARCVCTDDTLAVTFDGRSQSVFELETPLDARVEMTMVMDVKSGDPEVPGSGVQGRSYGVAHDDGFLQLISGTIDGTDIEGVAAQ